MTKNSPLSIIQCPYPHCNHKGGTRQTASVISCTKCHKTIPNPLSPDPGKFVKCQTCGHKWATSVKKGPIRCPNCSVIIKSPNTETNKTPVPDRIGKNPVVCVKCGYTWQYHGNKKTGELDECPNCKKLTPINNAKSEAIPVNKPKIFSTTMRIGEMHLKYTEPEIQALLNKYHLSNTQVSETAIKLFLLWIEMVENHNFSKEELINLKQVLQDSELEGLVPVIDKRLEFLEKSHKKKMIFGFGAQNQ